MKQFQLKVLTKQSESLNGWWLKIEENLSSKKNKIKIFQIKIVAA